MRTSMRYRAITALLIGAVVIPATPALAKVNDPVADSLQPANSAGASTVVLRRDGDRATPFAADLGPATSSSAGASTVVLRRDGDRATPFTADLGPVTRTVAGDGFDWTDAAIGAAAGVLIAGFAAMGAGTLRGRRRHEHQRIATTPSV